MLGLRLFNVNRWCGPSDWWVIFDICVFRKCGSQWSTYFSSYQSVCLFSSHCYLKQYPNISVIEMIKLNGTDMKWSNLMARVSKATAHDSSNRVRRVHIMAARGFAYRIIVFTHVVVNSPHKGQWRGDLMFSLICAWINNWVNNREAGDGRRHCAHHDVIVMTGNACGLPVRIQLHVSCPVLSRIRFTLATTDFTGRLSARGPLGSVV